MTILTKLNTAHFFLISGLGGGALTQFELPDPNMGAADITLIQFLNQNASGIGVILSAIGVSCAIIFYTLNYFETKKHNRDIIASMKEK